MMRGTTPDLEFELPFSTETIEKLWITFSQFNEEVLTVEKEDCVFEENMIRTRLTQEQTLLFHANSFIEIQLRVLTKDNVALASNIMKTPSVRILKGGII